MTVPTATPPIQRPLSARECLVCGNPLPANGRGRYCSRACQQRAYRLRQQPGQPALLAAWTAHLKEQQALLQRTIYACSSCEQRYLGQHRCPDCNLMCRLCRPRHKRHLLTNLSRPPSFTRCRRNFSNQPCPTWSK